MSEILGGTSYILNDGTDNTIHYDGLEIPGYDLEENTMMVYDVLWGDCKIGDEAYDPLLMQLARSPLLRRLQAVEQLTLPAEFSTIPNTALFSRWQHIWGSLVFVRKMTEDDERFSERDRIVLQLRTLFSDVGQTAFSHLGDWVFQTNGKSEDLHDQELRGLLETFGVDSLLDEYGLTLDETVFPEVEDWVECPSPDLCVDRVDYGLREVMRWSGNPTAAYLYKSNLHDPKSLFRINDQNMLEVTHPDFAKRFAASYNILPTEHWAQPAHRLQLELLKTAVKRALIDGHIPEGIMLVNPHPRDRLYGLDSDFRWAFAEWGGASLRRIMQTIARDQRQIYMSAREPDLKQVLSSVSSGCDEFGGSFSDFPLPLAPYAWQSEQYGLQSPHINIRESTETGVGMELDRYGISLGLPSLKARAIDPLVGFDGSSSSLSEMDDSYANFLSQQREVVGIPYEATILVNQHFGNEVLRVYSRVSELWPEAIKRDRDPENLKEVVVQAGLYAGGRRFDRITDW